MLVSTFYIYYKHGAENQTSETEIVPEESKKGCVGLFFNVKQMKYRKAKSLCSGDSVVIPIRNDDIDGGYLFDQIIRFIRVQ